MDSSTLIESFAEFAKFKNIDRPTMIRILEDVFRTMIRKKYTTDENFDVIINTSCQHMFPMRNFTKLNKEFLGNALYVLQSTDEDKYDDHINCVSGPEDLIQQSDFTEVIYSGTKELNNGMKRFMVIGR